MSCEIAENRIDEEKDRGTGPRQCMRFEEKQGREAEIAPLKEETNQLEISWESVKRPTHVSTPLKIASES